MITIQRNISTKTITSNVNVVGNAVKDASFDPILKINNVAAHVSSEQT